MVLLVVSAIVLPFTSSAQAVVSFSPPSKTARISVGVNAAPANPENIFAHAYVNMYRVKPITSGVYEGTLISTKSTGSSGYAKFNVRANDIVNFVGFTSASTARNTKRYTFTTPPYKNFASTDYVYGRICQINYLDRTTKLQSNGADSCTWSISYPPSDQYVVTVPKKYSTRQYGSVEIWPQETNDPLTLVRDADVTLYDELTGEVLGSTNSGYRGVVTFIVETKRPFYYEANKNGIRYGGRLSYATETPRVFTITANRKQLQNYYDGSRTNVMRLGAYPNTYQGTNPPIIPTSANYKVNNVYFSTYGNNIGVLWDAPNAKLPTDNGYAVMMKKGYDFTESDLAAGITPVYVPFDVTQHTFQDLTRNVDYYFKVGTGRYINGQWISYGNYSYTTSTFVKPPTACVKPSSVVSSMFDGTSGTLSTATKAYNIKIENIDAGGRVQLVINGYRLELLTANGVPREFNDGAIQIYSTRYSAISVSGSFVTFKISEKVAAGNVSCSSSGEIIRTVYVGDVNQSYTTANGKTYVVNLERVYGGPTGDTKKVDLVINGDRLVGVPWDPTRKQFFGSGFAGDDGYVTMHFVYDGTAATNFAVITISEN